jgi:hypothetical protein
MTLAGTKYREWKRSLEAAHRKAVDVHHAICVLDSENGVLKETVWHAVRELTYAIGMVAAIVRG